MSGFMNRASCFNSLSKQLRVIFVPNAKISSSFVNSSIWNENFVDPISKKSDINELEKIGKFEEYEFIPFKSAPKTFTCSLFDDDLSRKFTNQIMKGGHKKLARDLLNEAFKIVKKNQLKKYFASSEEERQSIQLNPLLILHEAVENSKPLFNIKGVAKGGKRYQVPFPITETRAYSVAMKWLVLAGRTHHRDIHFPEKLAKELIDAANNEGMVIMKKQEVHKQAEANKVYAHYRFL